MSGLGSGEEESQMLSERHLRFKDLGVPLLLKGPGGLS